MPYLDRKQRAFVEKYGATTIGQLTYLLFRDVRTWMARQPVLKYQQYAEIMGALEVTKLEVWDRFASTYETAKRLSNGDVSAQKDTQEGQVQVSDSLPLEVGEGPGSGGYGGPEEYSAGDVYPREAACYPPASSPPTWEESPSHVDYPWARVYPPDAAGGRSHKKKRTPRKKASGSHWNRSARSRGGVRKKGRSA
jgi:hypothetical protein